MHLRQAFNSMSCRHMQTILVTIPSHSPNLRSMKSGNFLLSCIPNQLAIIFLFPQFLKPYDYSTYFFKWPPTTTTEIMLQNFVHTESQSIFVCFSVIIMAIHMM